MHKPFPLPFANELPEETISRAIALIRVAAELAGSKKPMAIATQADLDVVIYEAGVLLEPIKRFLESDERDGTLEIYQAARRAHVMSYGGNE
jgi:hypothetical protein